MASAAEAETGALFINGQEGAHIRNILSEMGYTQTAPTVIVTDNSTAEGFATDRTKIKRSKAMDMRFYWIKDRVHQGQFRVVWARGDSNLADYFTKHHPPSHHISIRDTYIYTHAVRKGVLNPDARLMLTSQDAAHSRIQFTGSAQQCIEDEDGWTIVVRRTRQHADRAATQTPVAYSSEHDQLHRSERSSSSSLKLTISQI